MSESIFKLEGPLGTCELFKDESYYSLFLEDTNSDYPKSQLYSRYSTNPLNETLALVDAKIAVGLEEANLENLKEDGIL